MKDVSNTIADWEERKLRCACRKPLMRYRVNVQNRSIRVPEVVCTKVPQTGYSNARGRLPGELGAKRFEKWAVALHTLVVITSVKDIKFSEFPSEWMDIRITTSE
ncbi:Hypothetical predicted protein [Octopus vulgaris]|uniref:Uncharacterized protein n=1 Tax=Octopus vulgaris TaxID=6645 RepID=A0AA36AKU0_OCTVU|nr:Hypothetical predicted protein [Octopus vulgaris]